MYIIYNTYNSLDETYNTEYVLINKFRQSVSELQSKFSIELFANSFCAIPSTIISWFQSYLKNRTQFVRIANDESSL